MKRQTQAAEENQPRALVIGCWLSPELRSTASRGCKGFWRT